MRMCQKKYAVFQYNIFKCFLFLGVGPVTAMKLIREHKSLEKVVENLDTKVWLRLDSSLTGQKFPFL